MKAILIYTCFAFTLAGCSTPTHDLQSSELTDIIIDWNEKVLTIAEAEDGLLTLKGLRTITMMHIAMHDVFQSFCGTYQPYIFAGTTEGAHPTTAIVQAAYTVAVHQYPDQQASFQKLLDDALTKVSDDEARSAAHSLGEAAADAILQQREMDGWNDEAAYQWHPMSPGIYAEFNEHSGTPEGFIFGAGWGAVIPFTLEANNQFTSPPPPEIDSQDYTDAFNEVKEAGQFESNTRTAEQTHFALWWKDFAEKSHNRLARELIAEEQLDAIDANRLLARLNMSIFDAYVSSFYNKFQYNHWRPYTAIRWAANDENPHTVPDTGWTNTHQHTYAFPSYPSAHGTACSAAMTTLADTFGDNYAFTMTTEEVDIAGPFSGKRVMDPATRSFNSFSDAAMECALSRVYLGIHFRYDSIAGIKLGRQVGGETLKQLISSAR
ncbi:MAG: vanadium-dependent haloperoxidase [Rhodothermales bacterium]